MNPSLRRLQLWLMALLVLLLIAIGGVLALRPRVSSAPSSAAAAGMGPGVGPFLTASVLPPGLSGRAVPRFRLTDARGGRLSTAALAGRP